MQQLKDKLAIAERAAKAEAQLKVKILTVLTLSAAIISNIDLISIFFVSTRKNTIYASKFWRKDSE